MTNTESGKGQAIDGSEPRLRLNSREWDQMLQKLAAIFSGRPVRASGLRGKAATLTDIKIGALSALQESESCYYATAVIEKTQDRLKLARVQAALHSAPSPNAAAAVA